MLRSWVKTSLLQLSALVYRNNKSKILYYHDVYGDKSYTDMGTTLSMFSRHIEMIKKEGFEIVDVVTKPQKQVMLCFDDGFKGIYDTREYFYDNGINPTVFLAISLIGKPGYLSIDEIKELQAHGFRFQCHAWSHTDLTKFSLKELQHEFGDSKVKLSAMLGCEVDEICFPIGYFSQQVLDECRRHGYKKMYSSIPGNYYDFIGFDGLLTRNLLQFATPNQVKLILHGGNDLFRNHYRKMHFIE